MYYGKDRYYEPVHSFGKMNIYDDWKREHSACRDDVTLTDMSFMSKYLVQGRDAGEFLNYISTADVNQADGTITYTQWLDNSGKMQADLTVTRLDDEKFMVVATDT